MTAQVIALVLGLVAMGVILFLARSYLYGGIFRFIDP